MKCRVYFCATIQCYTEIDAESVQEAEAFVRHRAKWIYDEGDSEYGKCVYGSGTELKVLSVSVIPEITND